eukprot:2921877-Rhodomonas_salina.1
MTESRWDASHDGIHCSSALCCSRSAILKPRSGTDGGYRVRRPLGCGASGAGVRRAAGAEGRRRVRVREQTRADRGEAVLSGRKCGRAAAQSRGVHRRAARRAERVCDVEWWGRADASH